MTIDTDRCPPNTLAHFQQDLVFERTMFFGMDLMRKKISSKCLNFHSQQVDTLAFNIQRKQKHLNNFEKCFCTCSVYISSLQYPSSYRSSLFIILRSNNARHRNNVICFTFSLLWCKRLVINIMTFVRFLFPAFFSISAQILPFFSSLLFVFEIGSQWRVFFPPCPLFMHSEVPTAIYTICQNTTSAAHNPQNGNACIWMVFAWIKKEKFISSRSFCNNAKDILWS